MQEMDSISNTVNNESHVVAIQAYFSCQMLRLFSVGTFKFISSIIFFRIISVGTLRSGRDNWKNCMPFHAKLRVSRERSYRGVFCKHPDTAEAFLRLPQGLSETKETVLSS